MVGGCIIKGNTSHSGFQASSTRREIWNCLATCRWMQWFWTVPSQISANSRRYILDSGFWERLFTKSSGSQELVDKGKEHGVHVPKMVMKMALHMIKGSVQRAAGFSITDLVPVQHANACTVPAWKRKDSPGTMARPAPQRRPAKREQSGWWRWRAVWAAAARAWP